jgi:hypothetical protein
MTQRCQLLGVKFSPIAYRVDVMPRRRQGPSPRLRSTANRPRRRRSNGRVAGGTEAAEKGRLAVCRRKYRNRATRGENESCHATAYASKRAAAASGVQQSPPRPAVTRARPTRRTSLLRRRASSINTESVRLRFGAVGADCGSARVVRWWVQDRDHSHREGPPSEARVPATTAAIQSRLDLPGGLGRNQ